MIISISSIVFSIQHACVCYWLVVFSCFLSDGTFINEFAVHIDGDNIVADRIAMETGLRNHGQVCVHNC